MKRMSHPRNNPRNSKGFRKIVKALDPNRFQEARTRDANAALEDIIRWRSNLDRVLGGIHKLIKSANIPGLGPEEDPVKDDESARIFVNDLFGPPRPNESEEFGKARRELIHTLNSLCHFQDPERSKKYIDIPDETMSEIVELAVTLPPEVDYLRRHMSGWISALEPLRDE